MPSPRLCRSKLLWCLTRSLVGLKHLRRSDQRVGSCGRKGGGGADLDILHTGTLERRQNRLHHLAHAGHVT